MSLSLADMLRVRIRAQQPLQFFGVLDLHLDHPALPIRVPVHEGGVLLQRFVGLDDRARHRGVELGHRLDGLDRPEDGVRTERRGWFRKLDEYDVAQLPLRVVRDADFDDLRIAALTYPFVIFSIAQVFGDTGHGCGAYNRSARGASPAPSSSLSATRS